MMKESNLAWRDNEVKQDLIDLAVPVISLQNHAQAKEHCSCPIQIHTLGHFSMLRDDKEIIFPRKAQRKPLDMLKIMIAMGGCDVPVVHLADMLWPDAEGDLAQQSFESTLYRLRKLLEYPNAITMHDSCLSINKRYCWVDVWAFENLLHEAQELRIKQFVSQAKALTSQALSLYRGMFLTNEGEEASWMIPTAERLRSKFLRAIGWLARQWEAEGQWEQAASCYEHCLDIDDCIEEAYMHLMICYRHLNRRGEAMAVYRRCERFFSTQFGVEPCQEIKFLYASLVPGKHTSESLGHAVYSWRNRGKSGSPTILFGR